MSLLGTCKLCDREANTHTPVGHELLATCMPCHIKRTAPQVAERIKQDRAAEAAAICEMLAARRCELDDRVDGACVMGKTITDEDERCLPCRARKWWDGGQ